MRFRNIFLGLGSVLVLTILLLSDPDSGLVRNLPFGGGTLATLIILVSSILYLIAHGLKRNFQITITHWLCITGCGQRV